MDEEKKLAAEEAVETAAPPEAGTVDPNDSGDRHAAEKNEKENKDDEREEEFEHPDYADELEQIIRSGIPDDEMRERLADYHYNDIADVLERLTPEERRRLYSLLGAEEVSEIFAYLDDASDFIEELTPETAAHIVQEMDADDAVDVLEDLNEEQQEAIISHMDEESRADVQLIQSYSEDEIGSKMTTNFIVIHKGITVKAAMRALVDQAAENDNLSTIYVVDQEERFYGAITLQDLIIAREHTDLEDLITTSYPYVYDHEDVAACIEQLKDYSEDSIPVVDSDMKLLGIITSQDLVEVVDEEMGEDYAKLAGLTDEEEINEPLKQSIKKRLPWLITLMGLGLVVSLVSSSFTGIMSVMAIAVVFQSMIFDMSGNSGTQSLAVTIRILTDNEMDARTRMRMIFKEVKVGLSNGLILGILSFVAVGLFVYFFKQDQLPDGSGGRELLVSFGCSACIGLSMVIAMTLSSFNGTVIPMIFKKIGIDPAVASGPMITTLSDLIAVVTYYSLAGLLLNILQLGLQTGV
ncbi:MAG: magnesium transporter [Clostridia bacterium]|nr:magnesium transporter [Clostridia bacterium]MBR4457357.1 magnesium transporter [Clostridia bacterium]